MESSDAPPHSKSPETPDNEEFERPVASVYWLSLTESQSTLRSIRFIRPFRTFPGPTS